MITVLKCTTILASNLPFFLFCLHTRMQTDEQYENSLPQATQPQIFTASHRSTRDFSQCHSLSEVGTSAVFSLCQHLFHPLHSLSFVLSSLRILQNYISGSFFLSEFKAALKRFTFWLNSLLNFPHSFVAKEKQADFVCFDNVRDYFDFYTANWKLQTQ